MAPKTAKNVTVFILRAVALYSTASFIQVPLLSKPTISSYFILNSVDSHCDETIAAGSFKQATDCNYDITYAGNASDFVEPLNEEHPRTAIRPGQPLRWTSESLPKGRMNSRQSNR